jgi:hypothetical protein
MEKELALLLSLDLAPPPYPPATQRENILKGSLTRVFLLQVFFMNLFPPGPFEFLRKFMEIFEYKG